MDHPTSSATIPNTASLLRRVGAGLIDLAGIAGPTVVAVQAGSQRIPLVRAENGLALFLTEDEARLRSLTSGKLGWLTWVRDKPEAYEVLTSGAVIQIFFMILLLCGIFGVLLPTHWEGQTLGKRLLGLRTVSLDGTPPNKTQYCWRLFFSVIDLLPGFIPGLVGFGFAATNGDQQRIADQLVGTRVVPTKETSAKRRARDQSDFVHQASDSEYDSSAENGPLVGPNQLEGPVKLDDRIAGPEPKAPLFNPSSEESITKPINDEPLVGPTAETRTESTILDGGLSDDESQIAYASPLDPFAAAPSTEFESTTELMDRRSPTDAPFENFENEPGTIQHSKPDRFKGRRTKPLGSAGAAVSRATSRLPDLVLTNSTVVAQPSEFSPAPIAQGRRRSQRSRPRPPNLIAEQTTPRLFGMKTGTPGFCGTMRPRSGLGTTTKPTLGL